MKEKTNVEYLMEACDNLLEITSQASAYYTSISKKDFLSPTTKAKLKNGVEQAGAGAVAANKIKVQHANTIPTVNNTFEILSLYEQVTEQVGHIKGTIADVNICYEADEERSKK